MPDIALIVKEIFKIQLFAKFSKAILAPITSETSIPQPY